MGTTAPRTHRVFFSDLRAIRAGDVLTLEGDEAHHLARVRRVRAGDLVEVIDGAGTVASSVAEGVSGTKSRVRVELGVEGTRRVERAAPELDVCAPAPKGDRLDRMIDQLTQIGAASWTPLVCEFGEREAGSVRMDKLERHVVEACKQSGRAWVMSINDPVGLKDALGDEGAVVLDASGARPTLVESASRVRVVVGPEGGWSESERGVIAASGRSVWGLGPHVLRIETACVGAASIVMGLGAP